MLTEGALAEFLANDEAVGDLETVLLGGVGAGDLVDLLLLLVDLVEVRLHVLLRILGLLPAWLLHYFI